MVDAGPAVPDFDLQCVFGTDPGADSFADAGERDYCLAVSGHVSGGCAAEHSGKCEFGDQGFVSADYFALVDGGGECGEFLSVVFGVAGVFAGCGAEFRGVVVAALGGGLADCAVSGADAGDRVGECVFPGHGACVVGGDAGVVFHVAGDL